MAQGFYDAVPDLSLQCDLARGAGAHILFAWTFTGHDANTKNPLKIHGWEEWDLDSEGLITRSNGWFDAAEFARQIDDG